MREPNLPPITHLQFLVLGILLGGELPGRTIRETIGRYGVRRSGPAFYQMMARLERETLVEGWYEQITVHDQAVTERRYRIRAAGSRVFSHTRNFYENVSQAAISRSWCHA